jgi:hypothetical protein
LASVENGLLDVQKDLRYGWLQAESGLSSVVSGSNVASWMDVRTVIRSSEMPGSELRLVGRMKQEL